VVLAHEEITIGVAPAFERVDKPIYVTRRTFGELVADKCQQQNVIDIRRESLVTERRPVAKQGLDSLDRRVGLFGPCAGLFLLLFGRHGSPVV
jgi:hypothetical protein